MTNSFALWFQRPSVLSAVQRGGITDHTERVLRMQEPQTGLLCWLEVRSPYLGSPDVSEGFERF